MQRAKEPVTTARWEQAILCDGMLQYCGGRASERVMWSVYTGEQAGYQYLPIPGALLLVIHNPFPSYRRVRVGGTSMPRVPRALE